MRWFAIVLVLGTTGLAWAEDDAAKADALFAEAQKLKADGKAAEACDKFNAALRFNHNAVGAILNVALCDQQQGKVASAAKLFAEAKDRAREQADPDVAKAAEEHLNQVQPDVPHLAIAFAEAPSPDTKLLIDNQVVDIATAGDIAVDPGTRTITVTAPGRVPYETKVEIATKAHQAIAVPKLGYPVVVNKTRRNIGKVVVGIGAAAIILSEVLAFDARHEYRDAIKYCDTTGPMLKCGTSETQDTRGINPYDQTHSAYALGNVATGIGVAGLAFVGVGAYLWLFAPKEQLKGVAIAPSVGREQAGIVAVGRF